MKMSKNFPLPWWERVRERGKGEGIPHVAPFHPSPDPSREGELMNSKL